MAIKVLDEDGVIALASDIKIFSDATYPANAAVASVYSDAVAYETNDYCLKDGLFYKCIVAIPSGEAWTSAHWSSTQVAREFGSVGLATTSDIDALFSSW